MSGELQVASPRSTRASSASVAETINPNSSTEEPPVGYFKSEEEEDEEAPDQDGDATDSDVLWVGWDGPDDPADPKK
jgi:hypothetical protein